jgi:hypothetical protein
VKPERLQPQRPFLLDLAEDIKMLSKVETDNPDLKKIIAIQS